MAADVARRTPPSAAWLLSPAVAFMRFGSELEQLRCRADPLTAMTFSPAWWDAVPPPRGYKHRLLVMQRDGELVAALRFRERTVWEIPTGILHGSDAKGESLILCHPRAESEWIAEGVRALFRSRRCLALLLNRPAQPDGDETNALTSSLKEVGLEYRTQTAQACWRTALGDTQEKTLAPFGHRTRRNLRHALRRVAQNGWEFLPELTPQQVSEATMALASCSTHPYTARASAARLELERSQERSFSMGLRSRDGRWLSVLSGVHRQDGATDVFWQSNVACGQDSVGFIMRTAMMQHEGEHGTTILRWIGGTSPLMEHCCLADAGSETLITRPGLRLTLLRRLLDTRLAAEANPMKRLLRLERSGA